MLVGNLARLRCLFGCLRSDVLMLSANVGGKQGRLITQTGDAGLASDSV